MSEVSRSTPPPTTPARFTTRLWRAMVVVLAVAAATSWLQVTAVAFQREVLGVFSWKWWVRDQLYLSAAGYLLTLAGIAIAPVLLHLVAPRRYSWEALTATLAAVGSFCVLLVFERLAWQALLVVAIGIGVQVYRACLRHPGGARRWTARLAIVGHLATVVLVLAIGPWRGWTASRGMASTPSAREGAPNVLLVVLDTERAGSMSLYGAPEPTTPALAAWAERGVVFDEAYATAPWTLPSHATMFTGRYPSETSADWLSTLDATHPTLAEVFGRDGYATGGFVANVSYGGAHTGLARGFDHYEDTRRSLREIVYGTTLGQSGSVTRALSVWERTRWIRGSLRALWPLEITQPYALLAHDRKPADEVVAGFLEWLPDAAAGRPFFAFLNLFDAHAPYLPPARYRTMFDSTGGNLGRYLGATRYLDDTLDALFEELDRQGRLATTIVAVTSDHGELFGEHGQFGHGNELFRPLLHVPLMILNAPGAQAGTRVRQAVSLRDLAATLADLAELSRAGSLGGASLRPWLAGDTTWRGASPVVSEISRNDRPDQKARTVPSALKSIVDGALHVIQAETGTLRAFAFPADTAELIDLGGVESIRAPAAEWLRRTMTEQGLIWPDNLRP